MIQGIQSADARAVWPIVGPMLDTVIHRFDPGFTSDGILRSIESKDHQLWVIRKESEILAVIVTEINN